MQPVVDQLRVHEKRALDTGGRVQWTMECIGHAFTFPLNCAELIDTCIDVYGSWFRLQPWVPDPVLANPDAYFTTMLEQMSHLFKPRWEDEEENGDDDNTDRPTKQQQTNRHAELCIKCLNLFSTIPSSCKRHDTVTNLIKVMISITDSFLSQDDGESSLVDMM